MGTLSSRNQISDLKFLCILTHFIKGILYFSALILDLLMILSSKFTLQNHAEMNALQ